MAAMSADDPEITGPRERLAEVVTDTAREVVAGRLRGEVLEAAGRLLGLAEPQAQAHLDCLLDPTHGLITDGRVDESSIDTLIALRRQHSPSPELDVVASTWQTLLATAGLGTGRRT
jgi:hypothetical protein